MRFNNLIGKVFKFPNKKLEFIRNEKTIYN
jgi:hypothetical protein